MTIFSSFLWVSPVLCSTKNPSVDVLLIADLCSNSWIQLGLTCDPSVLYPLSITQ
jgi:hypothetical protein